VKLWAIYYGDGTIFTDEDGSQFDAPRTNIQVIVFKNYSMGWEILSQSDYYYYEPETHGWAIADNFGMYDVLIRTKQPLILFGRWLSKENYKNIVLKVLDDLPEPKTAWRHGSPSWAKGF
jgi:hypothetical protein